MAEGSQTFEQDIARLIMEGIDDTQGRPGQRRLADQPACGACRTTPPARTGARPKTAPSDEDMADEPVVHRNHARREALRATWPCRCPESLAACRTTDFAPLGHARRRRLPGDHRRAAEAAGLRAARPSKAGPAIPRHQPVGKRAGGRRQAARPHAGVRRPHRRGAHRPAGAVEQRPLHAHASRRQALRPRRGRHEDLDRRLRRRGRGIPGRPRPIRALSLALLLTSDEEGPASTARWWSAKRCKARGERIDYCIVGEPTSVERCGDMIKNGRRGTHERQAHRQGHAGPHRLSAPGEEPDPPGAAGAGRTGDACEWDWGNDYFPPTSWQISNIHARHRRRQRDPGRGRDRFQFPLLDRIHARSLQQRVHEVLDRHGLDYDARLGGRRPALPHDARRTGGRGAGRRSAPKPASRPSCPPRGGTSDGALHLAHLPAGDRIRARSTPASTRSTSTSRVADIEPLKNIYRRTLEKLEARLLGVMRPSSNSIEASAGAARPTPASPSATARPMPSTKRPGWCCGAWACRWTTWTAWPTWPCRRSSSDSVRELVAERIRTPQARRLPDPRSLAARRALLRRRARHRAAQLHRRAAGRRRHRLLAGRAHAPRAGPVHRQRQPGRAGGDGLPGRRPWTPPTCRTHGAGSRRASTSTSTALTTASR